MANIYDIASAIQQPNIVGNFNAGVQTGQQNQVYQEKQDAYNTALQNQQNISALAPKIIAGDPQATEQAQAIDPTQAATYQDAASQHLQRISGAISYIDQQTSPQAKEAAYQQVRPYLASFGQQPPATFAEAAPKMEQARAQIATLQQQNQEKLINVGAGGAIYDPNTKQAIYTNPGVAPKPQLIQTADGSYAWATPGSTASPVTYGGSATSPQGMPQGASMQGLPAETQAYVPKVMASLGSAQPFDENGQPTPQLLDAVQQTESGGNPNAVSPAGAQGAYQLMPATAASVGVTNPMDPAQSRQGAATYLSQLYKQFGGNAQMAIAAYNAGPGQVSQSMSGQPVMGPKKGSGESYRQATQEEIAQHGLPAGTSAQIASNGKFEVINKGDTTSGLTDDASEMLSSAAQQGYKIPIPSLGMKSGGDRTKFLNTLAKDIKVSGVDVPTAVRNMVYGESGIFATKAMQKNYGVTMQNEMSAQNQAQIALDASAKMDRGDIQALNQMWITGKKQFGSVEAQNYANAINTFAEEYAKVMSGANGAASATDSSRAKAHEMINTGLSQGQMDGVVALMKKEMRGRTQGQLDAIQSQVRGLRDFGADNGGEQNAQPGVSPAQSAQPPQQNASPSAQPRAVNSMGHAVVWNGSAWVPE